MRQKLLIVRVKLLDSLLLDTFDSTQRISTFFHSTSTLFTTGNDVLTSKFSTLYRKMEIQAMSLLFNIEKHETYGKACTRQASTLLKSALLAPITHFTDCYFLIQLFLWELFHSCCAVHDK